MNDEFKTEVNEPFAVLQIPAEVAADMRPDLPSLLSDYIGMKVLVISQDIRLLMRGEARAEVERMYDEIEAFLDKHKPADMTIEELKAEVNRLEDRRAEIGKELDIIRHNISLLEKEGEE